MSNNILFIALGAAVVGAASFGLYSGFRLLERAAINRRRTGGSLRELYRDNAESLQKSSIDPFLEVYPEAEEDYDFFTHFDWAKEMM